MQTYNDNTKIMKKHLVTLHYEGKNIDDYLVMLHSEGKKYIQLFSYVTF